MPTDGRPSGDHTGSTRELPAVRAIDGPGYRITVAPRLLDTVGVMAAAAATGAWRWAIIADDTVDARYGEAVAASFATPVARYPFPSGERHKTRETWAALCDALLADGHGRDSAILTLGGGVAGDLGGFVAATLHRGIPVVHVPTTLLAMVDASVGGKTAVDVPAGKNLVGAFHPPVAVFADPLVLATLPVAERRAGLAEMLKHGVVDDADHFRFVLAHVEALVAPGREDDLAVTDAIAASVQIKAEIVADDPYDTGPRALLNFGHTVAHALELVSGFAIRHGEAVAIGMVVEADAGALLGVTDRDVPRALREALGRAGLPMAVPGGLSPAAVRDAMRLDKKNRRGDIACALPARIGTMAGAAPRFTTAVPDAVWRDVLGG